MGRKASGTSIEIQPGLYLKSHDGLLHCYFRIEGRAFRRNTRNDEIAEAPPMPTRFVCASGIRNPSSRLLPLGAPILGLRIEPRAGVADEPAFPVLPLLFA